MPVKYRVIVNEIQDPSDNQAGAPVVKEVFGQTFETDNFDVNALAVSLNKKRRVRKARGKEDKA